MRIAICGTACQGKTTLITDIIKEWPMYSKSKESYRTVIAEEKLKINKEVNKDGQRKILNCLIDDLQSTSKDDKILFDRCPLDNLVYSLWSNGKGSSDIDDNFIKECIRVSKKYVISSKLWEGHQRRKREHKIKGNGFGYGIFNKDNEYTNTISARYYKDGSEVLISRGKNKNPRKLTERECARLQGFPENFKIPVSSNQAYKQFVNSVPVKVIEALGEQIIRYLKNYNISKCSQSESKKIYY